MLLHTLNRIHYSINITSVCTGKPNSCDLLYCGICFIVVLTWNHCISKMCLYRYHAGGFRKTQNLRMSGTGRTFWPFPESGHKILMWEMPFLFPEERNILISKVGGTLRAIWMKRPCYISRSLLHLAHSLCPSTFSLDFLFFKLSIKPPKLTYSFMSSSFPFEGSCVM